MIAFTGFLVIGLVLIILGALIVVFGQSISCFVAIEKNTRTTHELIRSQIGESSSSSEGNSQLSATDTSRTEDNDDVSRDNLFK